MSRAEVWHLGTCCGVAANTPASRRVVPDIHCVNLFDLSLGALSDWLLTNPFAQQVPFLSALQIINSDVSPLQQKGVSNVLKIILGRVCLQISPTFLTLEQASWSRWCIELCCHFSCHLVLLIQSKCKATRTKRNNFCCQHRCGVIDIYRIQLGLCGQRAEGNKAVLAIASQCVVQTHIPNSMGPRPQQ